MATQEVVALAPTYGAEIPAGQALPAPDQAAERVIAVPSPERDDAHTVQIFSSADPELGATVMTFAQQLHTDVYLDKGWIALSDLNTLGIHVDRYADHSTYLYVKNGSKVAACRIVHARSDEGGLLSLPTACNFEIDTQKLEAVAGVRRLTDIWASEVVEISRLVARKQQGGTEQNFDATTALYARMLRESLEQGHKVWLLNVERGFLRYLSRMIGEEQIHILGPEKEYMGPPTIPVAINPQRVVGAVLEATGPGSDQRRVYISEILAGIDSRRIPADLRKSLKDHEVQIREHSLTQRVLRDPKTLAYSAIMAYSASRAIPAASVEQFEGSMALLWGIDIVTAPSYVWGMLETFTGKNMVRRAIGAVVGVSSFIAPYAYYEIAGNDYPGYVNAMIASFIGMAVIKETFTGMIRHRREQSLKQGLKAETPSEKAIHQASTGQFIRALYRRLKATHPIIPSPRSPYPSDSRRS